MIKICKNCIMPNSRPRVTFNKKGVCNACENSEKKKTIDWDSRKEKFLTIIDFKKNIKDKNNYYDCVVPWSGGKTQVLLLTN